MLPTSDRQAIFKATRAAVQTESWGEGQSGPELRQSVWETRVRVIDLDGDGVAEVLELGWVGQSSGDGNSAFRILKKVPSGYRVLCTAAAERVNVDVRDRRRPLVVGYAHYSANEGGLEVWRVRGGAARVVGRYTVRWPGETFGSSPLVAQE